MARREWVRGMFFGLLGVLLLGCGSHYELDVTALTATRTNEDRILTTVTVTCFEAGVDCPKDFCLNVQWFEAEGNGAKLDEVTECNPTAISARRELSHDQKATFAMGSDNVLAEQAMRIRATVVRADSDAGRGIMRPMEITFP